MCGCPRTIQPRFARRGRRTTRSTDLIVSLELAPGAVIDERELIERLGIGRTPVREALRRLAHERLVEVYPRRGMFVTGVDDPGAGAASPRCARCLEPEAARLAARAGDGRRTTRTSPSCSTSFPQGGYDDDHELMALDERIHGACLPRRPQRPARGHARPAVLRARPPHLVDGARPVARSRGGRRWRTATLREAIRDGDGPTCGGGRCAPMSGRTSSRRCIACS